MTARYFPDMGGIETHCYEVARRLAQAGLDVTVLATARRPGLPAVEVVDGVEIRRVAAWPADRDYYFAPAIWSAIREGDWDIVHVQGVHTLVPPLAMLAARCARIPYVVTFHTGGPTSWLRGALRETQWAVLRPLLAGATRLIGVSRFEALSFRDRLRLPLDRFAVIPNGAHLPPAPAEPVRADGTLIVSLGRLVRYKGHQRIIMALPAVLMRRPDARVLILGDGPYEAALHQLARELGIADRVEIRAIPASDRTAMAATLASADLVTLLSDYEAHPIAVMEALALRRPVLVADTSGLRELAEDGLVTAISPHSTPGEVATAVLAQLDHPLVPAGVALPTWDNCVSELLALYNNVAGRAQPGMTGRAEELSCAS